MSSSPPPPSHGILSTDGSKTNNGHGNGNGHGHGHVTFDPSTAENSKDSNSSTTKIPPPDPSEVTAPAVNFPIKDEVELLRSGVLNVHGDHVKSLHHHNEKN